MSDMKRETVSRFSVSLPPSLLKQLDRMTAEKSYDNRSLAVADMIRDQLVEHRQWSCRNQRRDRSIRPGPASGEALSFACARYLPRRSAIRIAINNNIAANSQPDPFGSSAFRLISRRLKMFMLFPNLRSCFILCQLIILLASAK